MNDSRDTLTPAQRKREGHLSADGQWRSFPKVPHLLQYVSNGNYYGRIKVNGKVIRESLQTTVWTDAKLRLNDFLKKNQESRHRMDPPKFSQAVEVFDRNLENETGIKPRSKEYRRLCLQKIQTALFGRVPARLAPASRVIRHPFCSELVEVGCILTGEIPERK